MQINPTRDYLLVKPKKNNTTSGGLLLPGNRTCVYETSEIVAVGKEIKDFSIGEMVLHYKDRKENEVEDGCFLIQEAMIVATIK